MIINLKGGKNMSNGICNPFAGPEFGWTMELINPVPPILIGQSSNTFSYELVRDLEPPRESELSNIRIDFCPIPGLEVVDCSLTITYVDPDDENAPPITITFPNQQYPEICDVDNGVLVFEPIPSGNEVIGVPDNYEQETIILSFTLNQSLLIGTTEIDLKAGQNEWSFNICGFICETPPIEPCRGIRF